MLDINQIGNSIDDSLLSNIGDAVNDSILESSELDIKNDINEFEIGSARGLRQMPPVLP